MNQLLLLAALPGALLAQTLEGIWQGTLTRPNQNDGIRLAFKIDKNGNTLPYGEARDICVCD